jgi:sulfite reductase (ferredoxin)
MLPFLLLFIGSRNYRRYCGIRSLKQSNVIVQKQAGYLAIGIKVLLGDFIRIKRELAELIKNYGANELRFSLKQNIVLRI